MRQEEAELSSTAWRPIGEPVTIEVAGTLEPDGRGLKAQLDEAASDGRVRVTVRRGGELVPLTEQVRFQPARFVDRDWRDGLVSQYGLSSIANGGALTVCVLRDVTRPGDVLAEVADAD